MAFAPVLSRGQSGGGQYGSHHDPKDYLLHGFPPLNFIASMCLNAQLVKRLTSTLPMGQMPKPFELWTVTQLASKSTFL
jgi:hypothetical protein